MQDNLKDEVLQLAQEQGITLHPDLLRDYPIGTWFWAVHHQEMCEPLADPLVNRVRYILTNKSQRERKIRLSALRPIINAHALPGRMVKALAECGKALAECDKALAECDKARAEYGKALAECDKKKLLDQWDSEYPDHPAWNISSGLVF